MSTTNLKAVRAAMLTDLARSGLTERDMYVGPSLTDLRGYDRPGYVIRYPDADSGKPNGFARYRYLKELFSGFDKISEVPKYDNPVGESHVYFSRRVEWKPLRSDPSRWLALTEGEKKAESAAKHGIPCIGMGGVNCYKIKDRDELLPELATFAWKGRDVYLVYDSDAFSNSQVQNAADNFAALLSDHGACVRVIFLPSQDSGAKNGLDDYLLSGGKATFDALIAEAEEWRSAQRILRSDLLHRAVRKCERILAVNPEYKIFLNGTELVRVVEQEQDSGTDVPLRRPQGNTFLAPMHADNVELLLSQSGRIFTSIKDADNKQKAIAADPKWAWCRQIIANVHAFPDQVPWRRLRLVTPTPLLLADGRIVDAPGYHADTGVWFDPRGVAFPSIPSKPTRKQACAALDQFATVYGKFPFALTEEEKRWDQAPSYTAVLAMILSIFVRHLLPTVPMLGITAPEAGTGKTKIAESIAAATTGCLPARISYDNTEEFEKVLPVALRAGERTLLIDNVVKTINSPKLAQVLSTNEPTDFRVLGESRTVRVPNRCVIMITGNQLIISGDLPRRSLLCRLNANKEEPESRHFAFDPVVRAREKFPELTAAGLTALRYYFQAGCPQPTYANAAAQSGSFEEWNRRIRGMLVHLGYRDPLKTQELVRESDTWRQNDIALLESLHKVFRSSDKFGTADIKGLSGSDAYKILCDEEDGTLKWNPVRAGLRLQRLRDRVLGGGLSLRGTSHVHGTAQFSVVCERKKCETCPGKVAAK